MKRIWFFISSSVNSGMFLPSWSVKVYLNILSKVRFKYLAAVNVNVKLL